jgi:hypothetical protein
MSAIAREAEAPAAAASLIAPTTPGSNASRARADGAATAPKIRFGTGAAKNRLRKGRPDDVTISSLRHCPVDTSCMEFVS